MMHFPMFHLSPCLKKNSDSVKKFPNLTFSLKNFSIFIRQNFFRPFFSHWPHISNFPPIFAISIHFPLFRKILNFPLLFQISPGFRKLYVFFYILYVFLVSPYFDHDAFMHHTMHILDAPALHVTRCRYVRLRDWSTIAYNLHSITCRRKHYVWNEK